MGSLARVASGVPRLTRSPGTTIRRTTWPARGKLTATTRPVVTSPKAVKVSAMVIRCSGWVCTRTLAASVGAAAPPAGWAGERWNIRHAMTASTIAARASAAKTRARRRLTAFPSFSVGHSRPLSAALGCSQPALAPDRTGNSPPTRVWSATSCSRIASSRLIFSIRLARSAASRLAKTRASMLCS